MYDCEEELSGTGTDLSVSEGPSDTSSASETSLMPVPYYSCNDGGNPVTAHTGNERFGVPIKQGTLN